MIAAAAAHGAAAGAARDQAADLLEGDRSPSPGQEAGLLSEVEAAAAGQNESRK